jgi:hypothetical protein
VGDTEKDQRTQALAMERVIDGEGNLGQMITVLFGEIRARGDDMRTSAAGAVYHQAQLLTGVGGVAERTQPIPARGGQGEKAFLSRLGRKRIEKGE